MVSQILSYWKDFNGLCLLASAICAGLCLTMLLFPGLILWLFHIDIAPGAKIMSRRAAMLFAGLGVIAYQTRNAPNSPSRRTICLGFTVAMGGLALVGLSDYMRGNVGIGIWFAILTEVFFATAFFGFWRQRKMPEEQPEDV